MGEELCCSRQEGINNQSSIRPETNLINRNITNQPYYTNIKSLENNKKYQIQNTQLMYVKRNIKQRYNFKNKTKKFLNNDMIHFSYEIKPKNVKKLKSFRKSNLLDNFNENKNRNISSIKSNNNENLNNNLSGISNLYSNIEESNNNEENNKNDIIINAGQNINVNIENENAFKENNSFGINSYNNLLKNGNYLQNKKENILNINPKENIESNIYSNINIENNPTFSPNNINNENIVYNNTKNYKEDLSNKENHLYSNIFQNIDSKVQNNSSEINKIFNLIDSSKNQVNLKEPVLSDEEVDEILNQAEKTVYHNNKTSKSIDNSLYTRNRAYNKKNMNLVYNYPKQNIIYKKVPNNVIYQNNVKKPKQYYENRIIQNRALTPDKKKIVYPLTPDYQIRKKKNNNNIINYQYTPILEAHPKKIINYQYNNYTPIKSNNPQNVIKYQPPKKVVKANGKNYYLMPPTTLPGKKIIVQSPTKINPPIIEHTTEVIQAEPIPFSKMKNFDYSIYNNQPIYQHKKAIKNNNYINNYTNNITPIKHSSKTSLINHSYLNQIQKMNQNNAINTPKYNNINNYNNNNYLNLSFSSSPSNLSKTPRKFDKFGNPIYKASLYNTPQKLKKYENYYSSSGKSKSFNNFSNNNDNFSAPQQRKRKNIFNNYNIKSISSIELPYSYTKDNTRSNNNINNNNKLGKTNLYNNNNFSSSKSVTKVSIYEEDPKSNANMSIIEKTQEPTGLELDEHTNTIIMQYAPLDMTNPANFKKANYNLFYFTSPKFFIIPQNEIKAKKQIIYYLNNNKNYQIFYDGEINYFIQRHGLGLMKEPNVTKIGQWKNGIFSGWGRIIQKNGKVFEGKFDNNILNGKGVYKYKDVLYIGNFENGIRQGKGVLLTKNFKYKGQFNRGKIDGYGKIVILDEKAAECEYEGFFKENKIEGNGTMKWKNGNMFQGEMKNGKMNGRGRFIPKDGIPIDGEFKDNVKIKN